MNHKTVLILGGYGNTGFPLARLLLKESDVNIILAARTIEKCEKASAILNNEFAGNRVTAAHIDASDLGSMKLSFKKADIVITASSTSMYTRKIAIAAMESGTDYLDIQYSGEKVSVLKSISADIERAGRCFITEAGFHPGLPSVLVRYAAEEFDAIEKAFVSSVIKQNWNIEIGDDTVYEFVAEFKDFSSLVYKLGNWIKGKYCTIDFGPRFGRNMCIPMALEEMYGIPGMIPSLKETGFYIAGFNWFVDFLISPIIIVVLHVFGDKGLKPMGKLMKWGLKIFSKPPFGIVMKTEAFGKKDGKLKKIEISLYHEDGYVFTAIPVTACMVQYLDGSLKKPGLWIMGHIVNPRRLMNDMERMGVKMEMHRNPNH